MNQNESNSMVNHAQGDFLMNDREPNPVMQENVLYFWGMALIYGICFAVAFYRNSMGITYPVIILITLADCGLFLKKCKILWKRSNWW